VVSIGQWTAGRSIIVQFWGRKRGAVVAIGSMVFLCGICGICGICALSNRRRIGKAKKFPIFMRMSEERCGREEGV
jgi:hypothetical protein